MLLRARSSIDEMARRMGIPAATAAGAHRRLCRSLRRRFLTAHDALLEDKLDLDHDAYAAITAEIRARRKRAMKALLDGVPEQECERILTLPKLEPPPTKPGINLVKAFERIRAVSFELRSLGYRPGEIAHILETTKAPYRSDFATGRRWRHADLRGTATSSWGGHEFA